MNVSIQSQLEELFRTYFNREIPVNAVTDIRAALEIASFLEKEGFSYQLKDMSPKSPASHWLVTFSKDDFEISAENSVPATAICIAALGLLSS